MFKYVDAVRVVDPKMTSEMTPATYELAAECDRLRAAIVEDAAYVMRQLAQFKHRAERGDALHGTTPLTNSSSPRELVNNSAKLQTAETAFFAVFQGAYGQAAAKKLRADISLAIEVATGSVQT